MKNNFGFVLIKPQLGQNIGSCARVLKNFGFSKLSIVNPRDGWPNYKARMTSVGAYDMLEKVKVYDNTIDSVKNFDLLFSTTARKRNINKKHISISRFVKLIKRKKKLKIGIMFGPEASGLSNEDLSYSNYVVQIPTSKKFTSMNLSHSMTIICYEIFKSINFKKFEKEKKILKAASKKSIVKLLSHLINLLEKRDFFKHKEKRQAMLLNINNLFHRLELNDKEVRILASIISNLSKKMIKHNWQSHHKDYKHSSTNMTKRLKSKHKVDRRLKVNLWGRPKSPFNSRAYPPGQHGQTRKSKPTDYGIQLNAKQKLKAYYGNINERQFRNTYKKALAKRGDTTENLVALLESRLDTVVYRGKFAPTVFSARQLINHGHIRVNKKKVNISSYLVKESDVIEIKDKSKKLNIIEGSIASKERDVPEYIQLDNKNKSVKFITFK